ncbi:DUF6867 family protein [Propylenella binzhouense]|uniref:DUF6867 domain-containing protein n=1 Tax=Propylenella binzhouense TaxID=2555902 RepID=A0A964T409_9HYPH|nr:hypothetical protein [Propylenella binzhouense]
MTAIWEVSISEFVFVTIVLGCGAAWLTGRATARVWAPWWQLAVYVVLLGIATRFIHFSLFNGTFFLPLAGFGTGVYYFLVDLVFLGMAAAAGRQVTRARQMASQYGFLAGRPHAAENASEA